MIRFVLPGIPPSINDSHFSRGRRLKPATRLWIDQAYAVLMAQKRASLPKDCPVGMDIRIYAVWYNKNGTFKRSDLSNRIKLLEDVVAEVVGFDDSRVVQLSAEKVHSSHVKTEVDVWDFRDLP